MVPTAETWWADIILLLQVRNVEMTVGPVWKQRRPSVVGFVNWPQSSRLMATKLDEISRVDIRNVEN